MGDIERRKDWDLERAGSRGNDMGEGVSDYHLGEKGEGERESGIGVEAPTVLFREHSTE